MRMEHGTRNGESVADAWRPALYGPQDLLGKVFNAVSNVSEADWTQTDAYREGRRKGRHRGPGVRSRRV